MLVKANTPEGVKAVLFDSMGKKVPYVLSYDTETQEAEIALQADGSKGKAPRFVVADGKIVTAKVKLPGARLEIDGKPI